MLGEFLWSFLSAVLIDMTPCCSSLVWMQSLQSKVCKAALAGGPTNFMQIRGTTTHAAGGTLKSVESSVVLLGEALKAVKR